MENYRVVLASDAEILDGAVTIYTRNHASYAETTLDSTLFGANTTANKECSVCNQDIYSCPGHYSVIHLPVPIPNSLVVQDLKNLLLSICPICARILLDEATLKKIRDLNYKMRLVTVRNTVQKDMSRTSEAAFQCPSCGNMITSTISTQGSAMPNLLFYIKSPETMDWVMINPIEVQVNLQRFTQLEEVGFSSSYHPANFMTSLIPILPSKLRAKGAHAESALTTYYSAIVDQIVPTLENIRSYCAQRNSVVIAEEKIKGFIEGYAKLQAYYMLITNVESEATTSRILETIGKPKTMRFDANNCIVRRFKGKEYSIFTKGIIDMIHNVSARVVLGCGPDVSMREIIVPYNIANKLMFYYPVYDVNLNFIKAMLLKMNDPVLRTDPSIPRVLGIWQHGRKAFCRFDTNKAASLAETLVPGDWIGLSICNGDMVMETRHPANIEESLTSFRANKQGLSVVGMTLPVCKCKAADFDGDEVQILLASAHWVDISSVLLHSVERQCRAYKTGNFSFWFDQQHDDTTGAKRFGDYDIHFHNHRPVPKGINVLEILESVFPRAFDFSNNNIVIKNGKIDKEKHDFMDKEFAKFYNTVFGPEAYVMLYDTVEHLAYDVNRELGATFGFEIRMHGSKEDKERIEKIKKEAYEEAKNILKTTGVMSQNVINCLDKRMPEIKTILLEGGKGSNLDKIGMLRTRTDEYAAMCVNPAFVKFEDGLIQPNLADGMRTCGTAYRFSIDPEDYGYFKRGLAYDNDPTIYQFAAAAEELAIYQKFAGTAKQGYFANRLGITYGRAYLDHNGCVVDGRRLIGTQYGMCGLDPRHEIRLPLPDIDLSRDEFAKKFAKDKRLVELHGRINDDYERYTLSTIFTTDPIKHILVTGLDFNQIFSVQEKGESDQKVVDKFIKRMYDLFIPPAIQDNILDLKPNFIRHEYYFRHKFHDYKLTEKLADEFIGYITRMLGDAGEAIGMKAALSASEPLTQASLNAIHHKDEGGSDTDIVNRPAGIRAFEQRLAGAKMSELTVLYLRLFDDSREACKAFAHDQETFFFNEVFAVNEIHVRATMIPKLIEMYGDVITSLPVNSVYVRSVWNMVKISKYGITTNDIIDGLMKCYKQIMFILPLPLNSTQLEAFIFFSAGVSMREISEIVNNWVHTSVKNIIHGGLIKNCFVREAINRPGHFVIECNESHPKINAYQTILFNPLVDPQTSLTTDPTLTTTIYGIAESEARVYDSLLYAALNLSDTRELLQRIYKTIASVMAVSGQLIYATKSSIIQDHDNDLFKNMKFQNMAGFMTEYAKHGKRQQFDEWVAAAVMQQHPGFGEGISKVIVHP